MNTIAFIGGGNMASAIIGGLLKSGRGVNSLIVVEPFEAQRSKLLADFNITALAAADASLAQVDGVVWAVKPQLFSGAATPCAGHVRQALHLSVMAGIRSDSIAAATGSQRVVRAMPNTPALIGQGISGLFARAAVNAAEKLQIEGLLAPTGQMLWVESEADLDAEAHVCGGLHHGFDEIEHIRRA